MMPVYENNIWHCAIVMLQSHGMGAREEARRRACALGKSGNVPGFETWQKIEAAIAMLTIYEESSPARLH